MPKTRKTKNKFVCPESLCISNNLVIQGASHNTEHMSENREGSISRVNFSGLPNFHAILLGLSPSSCTKFIAREKKEGGGRD